MDVLELFFALRIILYGRLFFTPRFVLSKLVGGCNPVTLRYQKIVITLLIVRISCAAVFLGSEMRLSKVRN